MFCCGNAPFLWTTYPFIASDQLLRKKLSVGLNWHSCSKDLKQPLLIQFFNSLILLL